MKRAHHIWRHAALLAIVSVGLWCPLPATGAMSLTSAVALALKRHPTVAAARLALERQEAMIEVERSAFYPTLTASGSFGIRHSETAQGSGEAWTSSQALTFGQSIYAGGGHAAAVDAATHRATGAGAELLLAQQALALAVVEAHLAVLQDQARLQLSMATEQRLAMFVDGVKQQFRYGALTAGDVAQAESELAAASEVRRQAAASLRISGAVFQEYVGEPPGELLVPDIPNGLPTSMADALSWMDQHPALAGARQAADAAASDVTVAIARGRPSIDLQGGASMLDAPEEVTSGRQDFSLNLNFKMPLYEGGGQSARVRAASLEAERLEEMARSAQDRVRTEIVSAWEVLQARLETGSALEYRVAAAKLARDSYQQEATGGLRSLLEVIEAENDLLRAQQALLTGRMATIASGFRMLAAIGVLELVE